jgi:hypothetical protein
MDDNHDHGGVDWFAVLDTVVWLAVGVVLIIGAEMLVGKVVRERIAAGAEKYLRRTSVEQ